MTDEQLFEIAAKLHNLSLADLRLKKRYLDAVVIETLDGKKYTHAVADLELAGLAEAAAVENALAEEAAAAVSQSKRPSHTRKR